MQQMAPFNEPQFYDRRPRYGATDAELKKVGSEFFKADNSYWINLGERVNGPFRHENRQFVGILSDMVFRRKHSDGGIPISKPPSKDALAIFKLLRILNEAGYAPNPTCMFFIS